ncbi:MAG: DUF401 family protein [Candidatus Eisenbacteria bacterium]|nr:DUF401 family protein [Candidatus Eisenbacteria bacterium]
MLVLVLLKLRADLGVSLLGGSILLGIMAGVHPYLLSTTILSSVFGRDSLQLLGTIILISALAELCRALGYLDRFVKSLKGLIGDVRAVIALIPAFIGLFPMPGGAMLSAPLVNRAASGLDLSNEDKAFLNYWFRHIWEWVLPLYPGLIVASAILGVEVKRMSLKQIPITLATIVAGVIFGLAKIKREKVKDEEKGHILAELKLLFLNIWPFLLVIGLYVILKLNLFISLVLTFLVVALIGKTGFVKMRTAVVDSATASTLSLVFGVMAFKGVIGASQAINVVSSFVGQSEISRYVVCFFVPMGVGALTGVTQAYVGVTFPILMPFFGERGDLSLPMLAFAGGFLGVLLSPVHLCLALTREYFGADTLKFYKLLFLPMLFVFAVIVILTIF